MKENIRVAGQLRHATRELEACRAKMGILACNLSLAEELERRRIAAGLHDDIGHTLALMKMKLGETRQAEDASQTERLLDESYELLEQAIRATRSLTFELSSPTLHELGLVAGVRSLAERIEQRSGIEIHVEGDRSLDGVVNGAHIMLYRIVRELLRNVEKHARARKAAVALSEGRDTLVVTVEDNGVGFDATAIGRSFRPEGGYGLSMIDLQLSHLAGSLDVVSAPGEGTRFTLVVPVGVRREDRT